MEPMSSNFEIEVVNQPAALAPAMEELSRWLEGRQVDPAAVYLAQLALEELVTNCIKFAYDDEAEHLIQLKIEITPGGMTLVVEDDGHPFNPLEQAEPDRNMPIEDRPIGGMGLHLLRNLSDRMEYAWKGGRNRVTLHKKAMA